MSTTPKNGHFTLTRPICPQCVKLQEEIRRLREENQSLKAKLRYQQRRIDEGYFGASTHYLHGVTMGYLAKRLGISQGNVMAQLQTALNQLAVDPKQDLYRILFEPPDTSGTS